MRTVHLFIAAACLLPLSTGLTSCCSGAGGQIQSMPPTVVTFTPSQALSADFNQSLDPSSVTASHFTVMLDGNTVAGSVTLSSDNTEVSFSPSQAFTPGATYSIVLHDFVNSQNQTIPDLTCSVQAPAR